MGAFRQSPPMRKFTATMSYELHPATPPDARKLLRAELVGRRWQDRWEGSLMPAGTVWISRSAEDHQNVDDIHAACSRELAAAVNAVAQTGRSIRLIRAWVQVTGAGTIGLVKIAPPESPSTGTAPAGSTGDEKT
jgi:hypothetical protein